MVTLLAAGEAEGGARQFMEAVALGPGAWEMLPQDVRQLIVRNASTFLDEARDPAVSTVNLEALANLRRPVLLTRGNQSPLWFAPVVTKLASVLTHAQTTVSAGAGHLPMVTHPIDYADIVGSVAATAHAGG